MVTFDTRMPTIYLPHGGGPCFFMDWTMGPTDTWDRMADWLRALIAGLAHRPRAILVISGHWEDSELAVTAADHPSLLFDYYGFPPHTYELQWPAPGSPELAGEIGKLLSGSGFANRQDTNRGFDHGVFVPLKVALPQADIPTVALSLLDGLDAETHLAIGRALTPLRDEGVLIVGSGMSYHNMNGFMTDRSLAISREFGGWLDGAISAAPAKRDRMLADWESAPRAREAHPREEHLIPLMVVAGAAGTDIGVSMFEDVVMGASVSAYGFGVAADA